MNFIDDRELAQRFKSNSVPPKERFWYYLATMLLMNIFASKIILHQSPQTDLSLWNYLSDITNIAITIIGISICYRTNKSGDNKEFIERMICIGFPVIITMLIILIFFTILYFIILETTGNSAFMDTTLSDFIVMLVFQAFFYWRLNNSIRIAAH
ncbi:hypothetical protein [Brucella endophytica]|uniref:hypothetical protein n=1 Tax=Brucella endophytica TaxID=1963359 RepID=UPI001666CE96|nr:hypothetical protein [Brucella endophytica]